jgi:hypothetical protein
VIYVVGCVVGISCCWSVGISGIDGIGGIRKGVLIGWRSVGISGISGVDGIGGIRKGVLIRGRSVEQSVVASIGIGIGMVVGEIV